MPPLVPGNSPGIGAEGIETRFIGARVADEAVDPAEVSRREPLDGKDFDSNAAGRQGKCLRLDIMHYRTQLIGAWLTIDSRPGAGTTVR
jgi:hypothetical protein